MTTTNQNTQAISIKLDRDTYDLLHNFCEITGRTKTWVVSKAIREFIEEVSPADNNG